MSTLEPLAAVPYCYLTTIGRQTGRPHRIEIWFAMHSLTIYLLSGGRDEADWVQNLLTSPHVTVELGGQVRDATARTLDAGTEEDALARRLLLEKYQPGYGEDLSGWARDSLAVAVGWGAG